MKKDIEFVMVKTVKNQHVMINISAIVEIYDKGVKLNNDEIVELKKESIDYIRNKKNATRKEER